MHSDDYIYNKDSININRYETPLILKPGDELKTECNFNSMSRTTTTFWGDGTYDEMCYGFITYYPKGKWMYICIHGPFLFADICIQQSF
jgi:dopamine beta-monooxygenase